MEVNMGYYIQTPDNRNKADQIAKIHNGEIVPKPTHLGMIPEDKALIVVVSNGSFDAAALAYSQAEFEAFHEPEDTRSKRYVLLDLDKVLAHKLANYRH